MKNVFDKQEAAELQRRINSLSPQSQRHWGTMSVAQMLAHCNVTYELIYENKHPQPGFATRLMLKLFVKKYVTSTTPYKHNNPTAPVFLIKDEKDFEAEKARLIAHIQKTQALGEEHFNNKRSHSFGVLTKTEWNNMLYKHLDHHLKQFGA